MKKLTTYLAFIFGFAFASSGQNYYYDTQVVRVGPVPTSTLVYVKSQQDIKELKIFSTAGQEIYVEKIGEDISEKIIDVSSYSRGMYIVKIVTKHETEYK